MNFHRFETWVRDHNDIFMDLIRMYLGVGLCLKGFGFLQHPELLAGVTTNPMLASLVQVLPYVHIVGGMLLVLGLGVHLAALMQIPFLSGALFLVNMPRMTDMMGRESVEFSALVLFLMVVVFLRGPGRLSMHHRLQLGPDLFSTHPFQRWVNAHSDLFLDVIRVYLGVGLFLKGVHMMQHREQFMTLLGDPGVLSPMLVLGAHYVIPAHLAGGVALAFGVITRCSALIQIPALLGALVCVHLPKLASLEMRQGFEFSMLVLFLLAVLSVHGSGRLSVDWLVERPADERPEAAPAL